MNKILAGRLHQPAQEIGTLAVLQITEVYDISAQRGRLFTSELFDEFDHILVMDKSNYQDVLVLAKNEEQRKKIQFFLADRKEVVDPYLNHKLFKPVFKEIESRCEILIEQFKRQN